MKKVQVNTPLILEQDGEQVRIEAGAIIELTDEVYAEVSAHVTLVAESASDDNTKTDETPTDLPKTQTVKKPATNAKKAE